MPENKFDFCKLKNSSDGNRAELFFYGDIVSDSWSAWTEEDQYPANVRELIADIGNRDVDIRINSGGGDVFAGNAICNLLRSLSGKKTVYVDGIAASIASIIAMAGDEIVMPENAQLMIHKPFITLFYSSLNASELRKEADMLDHAEAGMIATYMTRVNSDITEEKLGELLAAETWLNGKEAAEVFNNITIAEPVTAAASVKSKFFDNYRNLPERFKAGKDGAGAEPDPDKMPFSDMPKNTPDDMSEYEEYLKMCDTIFENYN